MILICSFYFILQFSSTSSEESSCDESGRLRRPLRSGLRMGTLREGHVYTNALKQSDPEFTDSSEQSCDTVIYVGQNGQPLSDRDLTDNEGPPLMVPVLPKSSKLPRSSGGRSSGSNKSSGDDSDNKLSTSRDPAFLSKSGAKSDKPSGIAQPGVVQLPRKLTIKGKPPVYNKNKKGGVSEVKGEEQWVDGPTASIKPEKWIDGPSTQGKGCEQWVDGPGYQPSQPASSEQWIDGPRPSNALKSAGNESPSHRVKALQQQQKQHNVGSENTRATSKPPLMAKPAAAEQWVDGPQQFIRTAQDATNKEVAQEMWTKMPNGAVPEPQVIQPCMKPLMESSPQIKPKYNKQPLKAAMPSHVIEECKITDPSNPNHCMTDSNPSLAAQAPDSRPVSMHSTDTTGTEGADPHPCTNHHPQSPKVKEFVRDWVVKHSVVTTEPKDAITTFKNETFSTPRHELRGPTGSPRHGPMSMTDMIHGKKHHLHNGHNNGSHSAPCSPKLIRTSKVSTALPPPTNPTERTAMWVNSITKSPAQKHKSLHHNLSEHCTDSVRGDQMSAPECDQSQIEHTSTTSAEILDTSADITTDDLDTTTEEIPVLPPLPVDWLMTEGKHKISCENNDSFNVTNNNNDRTIQLDQQSMCQTKMQTSTDQQGETDHSQCSYTNRESIYELQMDEELEKNENDDTCRLTFTSDDDYMSTLSRDGKCENGNEELSLSPVTPDVHRDIMDIVNECYDVHKPLLVETNNNNSEPVPMVPSVEHLSPPSSEDFDKSSNKQICRPTCLRRPDGASNPNLMMECTQFENGFPITDVISVNEFHAKDSLPNENASPYKRSILGQSPDEGSKKVVTSSSPSHSKLPVLKSPDKPPVPIRTSSIAKPSVLPKPVFRSKSADSKPPPSPSKTPVKTTDTKTSSKLSKNSKDKNSKEKEKISKDKNSKEQKTKEKDSKKIKDKNGQRSHSSPPSSTPCSRAGSVKSNTSSKLPTSSPSSKTRSFLSGKSNIPSPKEKSSGKDSKTSKEKPSPKESKSSKEKPSPKDCKSPKSSRISFLPSSRKDKHEKESKLPVTKASNSRVSELISNGSRATDSDSGNDSGIASEQKKLLSPYSTLTKPRSTSHSTSSGHGSDNSSVLSGRFRSKSADKRQGGMSSGYESMIRDSEATGSSSTHDSTSESSSSGKVRGTKLLKKRSSSESDSFYDYCNNF